MLNKVSKQSYPHTDKRQGLTCKMQKMKNNPFQKETFHYQSKSGIETVFPLVKVIPDTEMYICF